MKPKLLSTLPGYKPAQFAADAFAGLTVAMVALPLSIAIAIASGADPATGLVTDGQVGSGNFSADQRQTFQVFFPGLAEKLANLIA